MKAITLTVITLLCLFELKAQSHVRVGLKINPIINHVIAAGNTAIDFSSTKKYSGITPLFGTNIVYSWKDKVLIETGVNYIFKRHGFQFFFNKIQTENIRVRFLTTTTEIPISLAYKFYSGSTNDCYLLGGYSFNAHQYFSQYIGYSILQYDTLEMEINYSDIESMFNSNSVFIGFKFSSKYKKKRVFEYGISYHYDFKTLPPIEFKAKLNGVNNFKGTFVPRGNYINFNFTYYIFNKKFKSRKFE